MHDDPAAASCLVSRIFDYGRGYKAKPSDGPWLTYLNEKFVAESKCTFRPNTDRGMPVRIGGASSDTQRFRGELRSLVMTNIP